MGFAAPAEDPYGYEPLASGLADWARVSGAYRDSFGAPRVSSGSASLPPNTLVHVELTQRPRSCASGDVPLTERIWVLVAQPRGTPAGFSTGPAWLGDFLRAAGVGGTVELPEPTACDAGTDMAFDGVPQRVFAQVGNAVRLKTGRAITARVLEACPAAPSVETYTVDSYQIPMFVYRVVPWHVRRERTTMRVRARCSGGEVVFSYGPVTSSSPLDPGHDPRPEVTATGAGR